jgi:hypothetical protein
VADLADNRWHLPSGPAQGQAQSDRLQAESAAFLKFIETLAFQDAFLL